MDTSYAGVSIGIIVTRWKQFSIAYEGMDVSSLAISNGGLIVYMAHVGVVENPVKYGCN